MAIYNVPNYKTSNGFGMPLNMRRSNPDPLDNSSVWSSYAEALEYAQNNPVAYVGQIITVVNAPTEEGAKEHTVDVYKIELDNNGVGTLVKVNAADEVADLDTEVQGIKTELNTVTSDLDTVKGKVSTLENDISTAKDDIDKVEESIVSNTGDIETLQTDLGQLTSDVRTVEGNVSSHESRLNQYDIDKENYATKDDVSDAKDAAIEAAKTETTNQISAVVSQYLTGEGAADTIDTLQEIVNWLNTEGSGAEKIVADVEAIQADYLKAADKTELNNSISDLATYIGTLPENATSEDVVSYIQEVVNGLNIGDYAKGKDLKDLADIVTPLQTLANNTSTKVTALEEVTIPAINDNITDITNRVVELEKIDHSHDNEAVLKLITQDKLDEWDTVSSKANASDLEALTTQVGNIETTLAGIPTALNGKVDKQTAEDGRAYRLLSPAESDILAKLNLNADGSVETGQTVTAGNVEGLADWITNNGKDCIKDLTTANLSDDLVTKIQSAITEITVDGKVIAKSETGSVDIPVATSTAHGTVMLGTEFKVADSGAMEITSLDVGKLSQKANEVLELNGGNASGSFE